jgi:hypothetical protein
LFHGGKNLVAHCGGSGVHHQYAVMADLYGDISSSSDEHVHIALHRQDVNLRTRLSEQRNGEENGPEQ